MRKFRCWLSINPVCCQPLTYHVSRITYHVLRFTVGTIILTLSVLLTLPGHTAGATAPPPVQATQRGLSELPIGMMVHPPSLDYFNKTAGPDDIGAVLVVNTRLLPWITSGKRLVMSPSVELAEELAAEFVDNAEYFGYNIEHWPDTPAAEQRDPAAAGRAAAEFAGKHNLGYVVGPDLQFTEDAGADLARGAEIYVIQGQRLQEDIPRFQSVVTTFAEAVRSGNPEVKVWVQVSASFGTPEQTLLALQTVADHIDGIWIHYNQNEQSFAALKTLVALLRPGSQGARPTHTVPAPATSAAATPAREPQIGLPTATVALPTPGPEVVLPTALAAPTTPVPTRFSPTATRFAAPSLPTPTPEPAANLPAPLCPPLTRSVMAALAVGAGGLIALGFALGYLWHNLRGD